MNWPDTNRVDLRSASRNDALAVAGLGVLALIGGPLVTLLGSVFLFGLILGPLIILGGVVALVMGIWGVVFPMSHSAMRGLGASREERERTLTAIEAELASGPVERVRLASGAVLAVTPHYFVIHGGGLLLARREDLLWAHGKVTTHTRYGFTAGKTNELRLVTRHHELTVRTRGADEAALALALFAFASPRAFVGYREDIAALGRPALIARVNRVPFSTGSEPHPFALAASPGPSGFVAEPVAPSAPSTVLPWAGLIAGLSLVGAGLLSAAFFGWTATHPRSPDDTRFGSVCSIASVVVCLGPGVLVGALAAWRLLTRRN